MTHARIRKPLLTILSTVAIFATAFGATGCVSREDANSAEVTNTTVPISELSGLTLQVGDQKGGTESLLRASGQLDNLPYKIAFSTFTSGPPQVEAATAGKIDFAVTGNTPPIFGAASDAQVRVVSAYANTAEGDTVLVPKGSPITSIKDLKGKSIAVGKGSSAHGHILAQLDANGLKVTDVKLVFLQPADASAAFARNSVDAWAIWDPYTAITQLETGARSIATATKVSNGLGFGIASLAALNDPKRNTALADLVTRIAKASLWAKSNIAQWGPTYAKAINIDVRAGVTAQERSLRPAVELTDAVVASEQKLTDLFAATGQISAKPVFNDWVDRRYNAILTPFFAQ